MTSYKVLLSVLTVGVWSCLLLKHQGMLPQCHDVVQGVSGCVLKPQWHVATRMLAAMLLQTMAKAMFPKPPMPQVAMQKLLFGCAMCSLSCFVWPWCMHDLFGDCHILPSHLPCSTCWRVNALFASRTHLQHMNQDSDTVSDSRLSAQNHTSCYCWSHAARHVARGIQANIWLKRSCWAGCCSRLIHQPSQDLV